LSTVFQSDGTNRSLHSFPTRRSSDLDEIVNSKDDVLKLGIGPGDFIVVDPKTEITKSKFIKSRFLDDKISVAILFSLIDHILDKDRKSTRLNSSHVKISYAVFCLKKK